METCKRCLREFDPSRDEYTCYGDGHYVCSACQDESPGDPGEPVRNSNCLAGMRCPRCSAREPFRIQVAMTVLMYDDGSEEDPMGSEIDWDDANYCECQTCAHYGTVTDFREKTP